MARDDKMGVQLDGSMGVGVYRLEVIEGPSGRRRRTKAERLRIAAEAVVLGKRDKQRVNHADFSEEITGFSWDPTIVLAVLGSVATEPVEVNRR